MWRAYYSVSTVDEALTLLDQHQASARIVAGGTDLIIEMERGQHPQLQALIDITPCTRSGSNPSGRRYDRTGPAGYS